MQFLLIKNKVTIDKKKTISSLKILVRLQAF